MAIVTNLGGGVVRFSKGDFVVLKGQKQSMLYLLQGRQVAQFQVLLPCHHHI